jgi:hypothetical protein
MWKNGEQLSAQVSNRSGHPAQKTIEYPLSGHLDGAK